MSDVLNWLFSPELGRDKLALLVLCAEAMYVLAATLSWRMRPGRSWFGRWVGQLLRLLYYVGIPWAVLWRGAVIAQMGIPTTYAGDRVVALALRLLGLSGAHDVLHVGKGLVLGVGALVLLVALWVWYARVAPDVISAGSSVPWWIALREALFLQVQWAFYRAFMALLTSNQVYIAFGSVALIVFPWLLDPRRRHDLLTSRGFLVVQDGVCALFTGYLSLSSSALWLLVVMHTLWLWVGGRVRARFSTMASQKSTLPVPTCSP